MTRCRLDRIPVGETSSEIYYVNLTDCLPRTVIKYKWASNIKLYYFDYSYGNSGLIILYDYSLRRSDYSGNNYYKTDTGVGIVFNIIVGRESRTTLLNNNIILSTGLFVSWIDQGQSSGSLRKLCAHLHWDGASRHHNINYDNEILFYTEYIILARPHEFVCSIIIIIVIIVTHDCV